MVIGIKIKWDEDTSFSVALATFHMINTHPVLVPVAAQT
jgi:hypothetical protein